ncbi:transcription factor bHLH128-like isoform X2 [Phoenix dactylifera]|uniref:Transcription factor bHLH128-like isoform X2 n=1 Tax=Phoenix dactylifera TaxID=42345 RepID=A0A8B7BRC0_PHODC|nr:transcription factor bHLH128-like isoform X2 [Phoenix dactylifera]
MERSPPNGSKGMAMFPAAGPPAGLARYVSAPGSLLSSIADTVVAGGGGGGEFQMGRFFSGESSCLTSESTCKAGAGAASPDLDPCLSKDGGGGGIGSGMPRSYGVGKISVGALAPPFPAAPAADGSSRGGGSPLIRHSSSPAGFLSHLMVDNVTRDTGSYSQPGTDGVYAMPSTRFKSQMNFSRQGTLSQISEISVPDVGESVGGSNNSTGTAGNVGQSYISSNFSIGSWDDTNSIVFSAPPSKRAKDNNGDIITSLSSIESQFSLPTTSLEIATVEKFLQIQQDQVPFKIRAKRGCATHPRSIAERERRTRISEKLRKLQELVPNMDKQTNTADMLDLAVQHINSLQSQVEILTQERENCICASKQENN